MSKKAKVGYMVDSELVAEFNRKAETVGISGARFVSGCMKAYVEGKFKMLDGEPFFEGQTSYVARETSPAPQATTSVAEPTAKKKPGPKTSPKEEEPDAWEMCMDKAKDIWDYKLVKFSLYTEGVTKISIHTEGKVETSLEKKIIESTFLTQLLEECNKERKNFTERDWNAMKFREIVDCSAMKFMCLNKRNDLVVDFDSLVEEGLLDHKEIFETGWCQYQLASGKEVL